MWPGKWVVKVYATEASIRRGAQRERLVHLVEALCEYGCVARVEWHRRTIVFEVPEDDFEWIVTGGLAEVLATFEDCLEWQPRFHERPAMRARGLPPPRRAR